MSDAYILSLIINLSVGIASGYILYRIQKRDAWQEERERQKQQEEARHIKEDLAMRAGLCAILRDRLLQACLHYEKLGYLPPKELENMSRMYSAYHDLGGNDMITILYTEVVANLPHTPPEGDGD